jgi:hypothetical protein
VMGSALTPVLHVVTDLLRPHALETVRLSIMRPRSFHPPHRDNQQLIGGTWVPNHTPRRKVAVMIYLSQCEGGELSFSDLGVRIGPRPGLAVVMAANVTHSVEPVTAGTRYAVTAWGVA